MKLEDVVMSFNRFIEDRRKELKIEAVGYCVLLRESKPASTFTGAIKEFNYTIFFVNRSNKYALTKGQYVGKVTTDPQEAQVVETLSQEITKELFELTQRHGILTSLIKGTYDGSQFLPDTTNGIPTGFFE